MEVVAEEEDATHVVEAGGWDGGKWFWEEEEGDETEGTGKWRRYPSSFDDVAPQPPPPVSEGGKWRVSEGWLRDSTFWGEVCWEGDYGVRVEVDANAKAGPPKGEKKEDEKKKEKKEKKEKQQQQRPPLPKAGGKR